jgi:hypothetical protein
VREGVGVAESAVGVPASDAQSLSQAACIILGNRRMTTLRKLPMMRPNRMAVP